MEERETTRRKISSKTNAEAAEFGSREVFPVAQFRMVDPASRAARPRQPLNSAQQEKMSMRAAAAGQEPGRASLKVDGRPCCFLALRPSANN